MAEIEYPGGSERRHHGERRLGDQRMEIIANSPLLRIIVYMVTSVGLPLIAWGLNSIVVEIRSIHESINQQNIVLNAHEIRLSTLERGESSRDLEMKADNNKIIEHEQRLKFLEDRENRK